MVMSFFRFVQENVYKVEPREERVREPDVVLGAPVFVVLAVDGVGGGEDGTPRVELGVDAGLGHGDRLLFHHLVQRHTVGVRHLQRRSGTQRERG